MSNLTALLAVPLAFFGAGCHEGSSTDPCTDVTCSGHGTCVATGDRAWCECDPGYEADGTSCWAVSDGDADVDADADGDGDGDSDPDGSPDADEDEMADADGDAEVDAEVDADSDSDSDVGPPLPPEDVCPEMVDGICEARLRCCTAAAGEDLDSCRRNYLPYCAAGIGAAVLDARTAYDPVAGRRLLEEGRALGASCDTSLFDFLYTRGGILQALDGTLSEGRGCGGDGLLDFIRYFTCLRGLTCRATSLTRSSCFSLSDEGEVCRSHLDCSGRQACTGTALVNGVCEPPHGEGEECQHNADCESFVCVGGATCGARDAQTVYCSNVFAPSF